MPVAQESLLVVGAQDVFLAPTRTAFLEAMFTISGSGLANGGHVAYGRGLRIQLQHLKVSYTETHR